MGGRECDAVSATPTEESSTVVSVDTTSVPTTATSGVRKASGKGALRRSRSGSTSTRVPPTATGTDLSAIREKVQRMLGTEDGEAEMLDMIKHDLLTNYILEVQAGQDGEMNPQHSRASRKQSKEIAELLIQLTKHG
jgi:hypothetical protein